MARPDEKIQRRIAFFGVFAAIVFSILLGRLWFLQILMGTELSAQAESNRIRAIPLNAPRGIIYDRNGKILVQNRPGLVISVIPSVVEKEPAVLKRLTSILGMPLADIKKKLNEKTADPLKPRVIKEDADDKAVVFIKEHQSDFSGVKIQVEGIRDYPYGQLASHILGYVGEVSDEELQKEEFKPYNLGDIIGKTGVERTYESFLKGEKGEQRLEVNASGDPLKILSTKDAIPGHNLVLTIDKDVQQVTEEALAQAVKTAHKQKYPNADAGAALVMNPNTGEILAMASYPSFDPQLFVGGISSKDWKQLTSKESNYPLNNRAITCAYPPGSTFKAVTGVAGLSEKIVSPKDSFRCSGRWTQMGRKWAKYCWKRSGHGYQSFVSAVTQSCDIYFYEVGYKFYKTGEEKLQEWARKFGLDNLTGVDLPFEAKGRVPDKAWKKDWNKNNPEYQNWMPGDTVNLAIGQGDLLTTPLQMANVYAAIANGGRLYQPTIAEKLLTSEGRTSHKFKPKLIRELGAEPETLKLMQQSLQLVCERGTAAAAFSGFPQKVAGKTGTAQVKGKDDFAWFACYAPADNPQYVVVVMIEQGGHGGSVAAPAARQILSKLFDIEYEPVKGIVDVSR
jgi:penicillin-binding protein 2